MAVKSPTTYGDYYWAMQVEAQKFFDESIEQTLSPYFRGIFADIPELSELPAGMQNFIRAFA
ncbi:unnamed protein product, partial [marine sediment metagenome]